MPEVWASGDAYEPYVGRWSGPVAADFLAWLDVGAGARWLDVGCGTGALSSAILTYCAPVEVLGIDPSEGYVAWAAADLDDPRARFSVAHATHLPAGPFDAAVCGLVLNFVPDPAAALAAMRDAAPGGVVAAYVWDYAGRMELMRHFWDAAAALDPAAADLDEGIRFPLCRPDRLEDLWYDAGLADVASQAIDVPTVFRDFDDYWSPFLGGQAPRPGLRDVAGRGAPCRATRADPFQTAHRTRRVDQPDRTRVGGTRHRSVAAAHQRRPPERATGSHLDRTPARITAPLVTDDAVQQRSPIRPSPRSAWSPCVAEPFRSSHVGSTRAAVGQPPNSARTIRTA
jgi:SAM-dependent methyltransferase